MRKVYLVTKSDYAVSDAIMAFESEEAADMLKESLGSRMYEVQLVPFEKPTLQGLMQTMEVLGTKDKQEAPDGKEN